MIYGVNREVARRPSKISRDQRRRVYVRASRRLDGENDRHSDPSWQRMNGDPSPQAMPLCGPCRIFSLTVASFFRSCGKTFQQFCQPTVRRAPQPLRLFRRQPIPEPDTDLLDALDAPNASGQVWAQQPAVRRLVGEAAHCAEAEIDGAGRQMSRFQADSITQDDGLAEREPGLLAVPFNEFVNRMPVPHLSVDRAEAV